MFPELSTERFLLQRILPEDQAFVFEGLSHPQVIPFYGVRYDSFEAAKAQMDWYEKLWREGSGVPWKIVDKETKEKIGVIAVYHYQPVHKKAEIGFWLLPQFWHKGIATETLKAVINYWQKRKGLHRLEAFVEEGNKASDAVLKKIGFAYEGTMRECEIKNGKYISLRMYSLLSSDKVSLP